MVEDISEIGVSWWLFLLQDKIVGRNRWAA